MLCRVTANKNSRLQMNDMEMASRTQKTQRFQEDYDDNFFDLEDKKSKNQGNRKVATNYTTSNPTAMNTNGINSVNSSVLEESVSHKLTNLEGMLIFVQIISKTIKSLADKAYELSIKYDLQDEAKLIQQEEL